MQTNKDDYVIEVLLDAGMITPTQIAQARAETARGSSIVDTMIRLEFLTEIDVTRTLAASSSMDFVDLTQISVPSHVIDQIPMEIARRYKAIPISEGDSALVVAISDPLDFETLDSLGFLLKREVEMVCATPEQIKQALVKYYGSFDEALQNLQDRVGSQEGDDAGPVIAGQEAEGDVGDAPIVRMVSMIILEAQRLRASDIHLEPMEKVFRVRFRIDGMLTEMQSPPKKLQSAIVSRLKIMSGSMSIAEKRLPQDGRIQVRLDKDKTIDLRVSTVPTNHGESVVMRILDKSSLTLGLPQLGFLSDDQQTFEKMITLPDGILLVTGPTGSGKTTTLYACLNYINKPDRKIITVEDPVEYQLSGINQVQVNAEIGMNFPKALRSMLRQAPNIIMVGEIRDSETANIAMSASQTGHLVFSTLHTNDAPGAIARLVDMGVQPFMVASSMRAIMAQRLVRRLCTCTKPGTLKPDELESLHLRPEQLDNASVMQPFGCDRCRNTGYKGRAGIFEILVANDDIRAMVNQRLSTVQLRMRARELGMRTLREDGIRKVLSGMTTAEEVISATMGDAE